MWSPITVNDISQLLQRLSMLQLHDIAAQSCVSSTFTHRPAVDVSLQFSKFNAVTKFRSRPTLTLALSLTFWQWREKKRENPSFCELRSSSVQGLQTYTY